MMLLHRSTMKKKENRDLGSDFFCFKPLSISKIEKDGSKVLKTYDLVRIN